jgi:carbonic anhydrase
MGGEVKPSVTAAEALQHLLEGNRRYSTRTAGQVIDRTVLGSIEFGVAEMGVPLIMVLGHERCGAIKTTIEVLEKGLDAPGQIEMVVESIRPAVEKTKGQPGNLLENAVRANIELTVSRLKASPILAEAIAKNQLKIVGARYDLDTGAVALTVS